MKITNRKVINLKNAIWSLERVDRPIPTSLAYTLSKHQDILDKHFLDYIKAEEKLLDKHGTKGDDGKVKWVTIVNTENPELNKREPVFSDENLALFELDKQSLQDELVEVSDYKCKLSKMEPYKPKELLFYGDFYDFFITED